jgi:hypothetical protein
MCNVLSGTYEQAGVSIRHTWVQVHRAFSYRCILAQDGEKQAQKMLH